MSDSAHLQKKERIERYRCRTHISPGTCTKTVSSLSKTCTCKTGHKLWLFICACTPAHTHWYFHYNSVCSNRCVSVTRSFSAGPRHKRQSLFVSAGQNEFRLNIWLMLGKDCWCVNGELHLKWLFGLLITSTLAFVSICQARKMTFTVKYLFWNVRVRWFLFSFI